jgi:hypothetical protein
MSCGTRRWHLRRAGCAGQLTRESHAQGFLAAIGPVGFNKLVVSVGASRQKGRLRHWQEQLLSAAARQGSPSVATVDEFARLFSGFSPEPIQRPPVTKELFLDEIRRFPYAGMPPNEIPPDWMAAAWAIDHVREELLSVMARTVSKTGELYYEADYLALLAASLTVEQQVEMFVYLRDHGHRESEFRVGFEVAFPACVAFLPPPLPEDWYDDDIDGWRQPSRWSRTLSEPFLNDDIPC